MATLSECTTTQRLCKLPGCASVHVARGFCNRHYRQWKRGALTEAGASLRPVRRKEPQAVVCCAEGCQDPSWARSLCSSHYSQWRRGMISENGDHIRARLRSRQGEGPRSRSSSSEPLSARRYRNADGYVMVHVEQHAPGLAESFPLIWEKYAARDTLYTLEHRLAMEMHLGRPLGRKEIVHHRNGQRADNRIKNLELKFVAHHPGADLDLNAALELLDRTLHAGMPGAAEIQETLVRLSSRLEPHIRNRSL